MDYPIDEKVLAGKLVATWHLNVPERRSLPGGRVKATLILDAIEEQLRSGGWFPADICPEEDFEGGLIELLRDGSCRIYWKSEFSYLRYTLKSIEEFATPRDAAIALVRAVFGEQIDGIPIDWQA